MILVILMKSTSLFLPLSTGHITRGQSVLYDYQRNKRPSLGRNYSSVCGGACSKADSQA